MVVEGDSAMRTIASAVCLICLGNAATALDPETKSPYAMRVLVSVADHPHFTEHFRREFKRELQGSLQAALGGLSTVEVLEMQSTPKEKWPTLWRQVDEKGLESLDSFHEVGGGKTHFLQLTYSNGHYDLRGRQHDGTTGFATPIVRKARTHDRGFIGRLAGLMIGLDFGIVATLEPGPGPKFFVKIKGAETGTIERWIRPGEVLALIKIHQERRRIPADKEKKTPATITTATVGNRVDGVLLRVEKVQDGGALCDLLFRYEDPISPRGALGFRCVKLGTTEAPLQLRLVDPNGASHKSAAIQVYARSDAYPDGSRESDRTTAGESAFFSKDKFAHVAFVRVMLGATPISRMPVEIMDENVTLRTIRLEPGAELRDRLEADRRGILNRITDGRLIQVRGFQDITEFEKTGKKQEAFDRGQSILKTLDSQVVDLREDIDKLRARIAKDLPNAANLAVDCDQQLLVLNSKQDELRQHLEALKVAIAEDNDPNVVEKKKKITDAIRRAELLASQAEYDDALKAYEDALALVAAEPAIKERVEKAYQSLKQAWTLKEGDAAHAEARNFIWTVWAKFASLQDVRDKLPDARKAFEKCKSVGDRLSVNKMHLVGVEVATRFGDELKKLIDTATEEEDKKTLEAYQKVNEDLQKLLKDVQDWLVEKK
jgi:tetratricopeptide (TPR) repeat protein